MSIDSEVAAAIELRASGRLEESRDLLAALRAKNPEHPVVAFQCAWAHDRLGLEREAVPLYETALRLGLQGDDRRGALLGLGSTYRALGEYESALDTLRQAAGEYPDDRSIQVFLAMALYNSGDCKGATELLLRALVETSGDPEIMRYRAALTEYAADLDRTW